MIVDTSTAYFEGDDENNNVQMGKHARMLRSLAKLPGGPTIIIRCHPTKKPLTRTTLCPGAAARSLTRLIPTWFASKPIPYVLFTGAANPWS